MPVSRSRHPGARRRPLNGPRQLRQAAFVAAVFVLSRVIYYSMFAGADGTGIRLLSLPLVALPAPFTGVALLGPVTSGGLVAALLSALPFAAAIVGFGALSAVFDVRRWLVAAARRGPARSLARATAIAWQLVPALGVAVRRNARAARLRGERPGPSTLVPVLEESIERAVALAASLELRGFAATGRIERVRAAPARMSGVVLTRPGWSLAISSLTLAPGTLTVLAGATGSGKSTLLDALSGLFQHVDGGSQCGTIVVGGADRLSTPPRDTAGFVAAVAQRVRLAFVGETVAEEIGYALTLRGVAPAILAERVREAARRLGVAQLIDRPIAALSAGEAELVALAAATVEHPTLLLVDEPLAELDAIARPRVVGALAALAHQAGVCVVVAEHRTGWFADVADGWLGIVDGELRSTEAVSSEPLRSGHQFCRPRHQRCHDTAPLVPSTKCSPQDDGRLVVAVTRDVSVRRDERLVVDAAALELHAGELVALVGPNGAGKSSLLDAIALPGETGRVFVRGHDVRTMGRRARHSAVALVPEDLEDLFVTDSVGAECRRADRHAGAGTIAGTTLTRFTRLAGTRAGTVRDALADVHPRDLSGGQRVCLAIALQLAAAPAVLLVDEPVRGLDEAAREQLADTLRGAAGRGTAVLFATHEHEFAAGLADRTLRLKDARLDPDPASGKCAERTDCTSCTDCTNCAECTERAPAARAGHEAPA